MQCGAKVYYASEVTEGNEKTTFNKEMGEQPLEEPESTGESDRYGGAWAPRNTIGVLPWYQTLWDVCFDGNSFSGQFTRLWI